MFFISRFFPHPTLHLPKLQIDIIGMYRAPPQTNFQSSFLGFMNDFDEILIIGDFNLNLFNKDNSRSVADYHYMVNSIAYQFVNNFDKTLSTRVLRNSSTLIDHILTNLLCYKYYLSLEDNHLSDHKLIRL